MYNYKLQLEYPKTYPTVEFNDGFDLNDRENVKALVNEALECLSKKNSIRFSEEEVKRAGYIVESILEEGLQGVDDRKSLIGYVVDNYDNRVQTFDKISSGIDAIRSKQESHLTFDEEERT